MNIPDCNRAGTWLSVVTSSTKKFKILKVEPFPPYVYCITTNNNRTNEKTKQNAKENNEEKAKRFMRKRVEILV